MGGVAYEYHGLSCILDQKNTSSSKFNTLRARNLL